MNYFSAVNALAPPPDLHVILHFIQLTVDKYDAEQRRHKCSYALKFKILGQKCSCMSFCHIYMSNHTSAVFVSNITSANVILYNKLILVNIVLYLKHNIVCLVQFCQQKHARNALNDGLELCGLLVDHFYQLFGLSF